MLVFSGCKINLGLYVINKRSDGFHDLETVFYPLKWNDAIEVLENTGNHSFTIDNSGLSIPGNTNIISKAYELLKKEHSLPAIKVHLLKTIPMGAGLGGGSSNAINFIHLMNKKFGLHISDQKKIEYAKQLGSDCAFFVRNEPVLAKEKGDVFEPIGLDLSNYFIHVVYPNVHSDTKQAYQGVLPKRPEQNLKTIIETKPMECWKDLILNDFEASVFAKLPQLKEIKEELYNSGAVYASMSGSGSAVYGIFKSKPKLSFANYQTYTQEPVYSKV